MTGETIDPMPVVKVVRGEVEGERRGWVGEITIG